jgi:hypothetical protein
MRRGMMDWQPEEVPAQLLQARVQAVAQYCRAQGLAAVVLYSNFTRPVDVALLTHFVPFWSQALLAVTATGRTALVMSTTGRTVQWIRSTSVVDHVAVGKQIGDVLAAWLAQEAGGAAPAPYGLVHPLDMPQPLIDQLAQGLAPAASVDVSTWWASTAATWPTPAAVAERARAIADAAFTAVARAPHANGHSVVAVADGTCRSQGAEEVAVFVAPNLARSDALCRLEGDAPLGERVAVQVSVAYKGHWVRQTRSFDQRNSHLIQLPQAEAADAALLQWPAAGASPAHAAATIAQALGAELDAWTLEQPARGTPLAAVPAPDSDLAVREGNLTLRLRSPSGPVLWGAPLPVVPSAPSSSSSTATV